MSSPCLTKPRSCGACRAAGGTRPLPHHRRSTASVVVVRATAQPAQATTVATAASQAQQDVVTVTFRAEGVSTEAKPGEDFLDVASRCNVTSIPTGCLHGSCGVCEVELHKFAADGAAGSPVLLRACVAKVPRGFARVEVALLADDQVWGQDGWDT